MEEIVKNMIEYVNKTYDYELASMIHDLLSEMAITINCPSNWRDMGEEFALCYKENNWITQYCKLYDFYDYDDLD